MNGTTFDALTAARELKAAGFEPTQAEALAAQLRTAAGADHDALATKSSITALKSDQGKITKNLLTSTSSVIKWSLRQGEGEGRRWIRRHRDV